jgi:hypothetical protein
VTQSERHLVGHGRLEDAFDQVQVGSTHACASDFDDHVQRARYLGLGDVDKAGRLVKFEESNGFQRRTSFVVSS